MPTPQELIQALQPVGKNGQPIPASSAETIPGLNASQTFTHAAGEALGINDAIKALRGQMSPEESEKFASEAALGLLPGLKGAIPAATKLAVMIGPKGWNLMRGARPSLDTIMNLTSKMSPEERFGKYGVFQGSEGLPRRELKDVGAQLKQSTPEGLFELKHPEVDLHKLYDVPPIIAKNLGNKLGIASTTHDEVPQIHFNRDPRDLALLSQKNVPLGDSQATTPTAIALHEMQHAIQQKEGFSPGFNPTLAPYTSAFWEKLGTPQPDYQGLWNMNQSLSKRLPTMTAADYQLPQNAPEKIARELYTNAMGEVEARNVANRFAHGGLYGYHPLETAGVPSNQQFDMSKIVRALRGIAKTQ